MPYYLGNAWSVANNGIGDMKAEALNRRQVVAELLVDREKLLVCSGLGSATYDVMAAGDHVRNFYLWGAMGSAAMIGLGLARSRPDENILVITGDGEMLMGLGSLATIAVQSPTNLSIVVLDNGHYGETGMQTSHCGHGVALDRVADSLGFDYAAEIDNMDAVADFRQRVHRASGLNFASIRVDIRELPRVLPSRDGIFIKNRLKTALID